MKWKKKVLLILALLILLALFLIITAYISQAGEDNIFSALAKILFESA